MTVLCLQCSSAVPLLAYHRRQSQLKQNYKSDSARSSMRCSDLTGAGTAASRQTGAPPFKQTSERALQIFFLNSKECKLQCSFCA